VVRRRAVADCFRTSIAATAPRPGPRSLDGRAERVPPAPPTSFRRRRRRADPTGPRGINRRDLPATTSSQPGTASSAAPSDVHFNIKFVIAICIDIQ